MLQVNSRQTLTEDILRVGQAKADMHFDSMFWGEVVLGAALGKRECAN